MSQKNICRHAGISNFQLLVVKAVVLFLKQTFQDLKLPPEQLLLGQLLGAVVLKKKCLRWK